MFVVARHFCQSLRRQAKPVAVPRAIHKCCHMGTGGRNWHRLIPRLADQQPTRMASSSRAQSAAWNWKCMKPIARVRSRRRRAVLHDHDLSMVACKDNGRVSSDGWLVPWQASVPVEAGCWGHGMLCSRNPQAAGQHRGQSRLGALATSARIRFWKIPAECLAADARKAERIFSQRSNSAGSPDPRPWQGGLACNHCEYLIKGQLRDVADARLLKQIEGGEGGMLSAGRRAEGVQELGCTEWWPGRENKRIAGWE